MLRGFWIASTPAAVVTFCSVLSLLLPYFIGTLRGVGGGGVGGLNAQNKDLVLFKEV